jgi:hypothetical protein
MLILRIPTEWSCKIFYKSSILTGLDQVHNRLSLIHTPKETKQMTNSTVANNFNSISYEVISIEKLKQLITDPNTSYQLMRYYIDELEETEALLSH